MDASGWSRIERALLAEGPGLPDGTVTGTDLSDWQALLDLVGRRPWRSELTHGGAAGPVPSIAGDLFSAGAHGLLAIWVTARIRINVFCNAPTEILFDFSAEEVEGGGMAIVGAFVRDLGRAVGKVVRLSHEGDGSLVFLVYDPQVDRFDPVA